MALKPELWDAGNDCSHVSLSTQGARHRGSWWIALKPELWDTVNEFVRAKRSDSTLVKQASHCVCLWIPFILRPWSLRLSCIPVEVRKFRRSLLQNFPSLRGHPVSWMDVQSLLHKNIISRAETRSEFWGQYNNPSYMTHTSPQAWSKGTDS